MKWDLHGALMINRRNPTSIFFLFICCSKHKLFTLLKANVANLARFVMLTF